MSDLKAQLEITTKTDGVEAGVTKVKRSLADLGATAAVAGKQASDSISGIGAGGGEAAAKVDAVTRNMIGSIQRTTATLEAGSRSSSKYFEVLAQQRGVDVGALKPYLDQLDAVAAKQRAVESSLSTVAQPLANVGQSAKATAAALRGVPAQFTDIVTSLQAGQSPITVFLQQGGQLKDMFGGLGPAARALGGYVAGLVNPFSVAAVAAGVLLIAFREGNKEAEAYNKAIILSGNAAGTTTGQLQAAAQRISAITGTQSAAAEALAKIAAGGELAGRALERFALIAIKMERETGQAVAETVRHFEELGKEPAAASAKLNERTNFLTASIYLQIKALEDQGRIAEAGALAQNAYADAMEARTAKIADNLGLVERAWRGVTGVAKSAWDAMLNVGRADTLQDKLAKVSAEIAKGKAAFDPSAFGGNAEARARLQSNLQLQESLQEMLRLETRGADASKAAADQTKARISFEADGNKFLSSKAKLEKEITEARNKGVAAGLSQEAIEKRVADIRASHKDLVSAGLGVDKAKLTLDIDAIKKASDQLIGTYANAEKIIESLRAAGTLSDKEYYDSKRAFINLETAAKEDALRQELERLQREKLAGKDKIDNDRKIADAAAKLAILRADSASKLEIVSNQEDAAAKRLQLGYLSARQAAQDYFEVIQRQQEREIASAGLGTRQRNFNSGLNQIEDRYAGQRRDLENQKAQLELEGKFTSDARAQYETRLAIINEYQAKAIASYTKYYDELMKQQGDWALGASRGLQDYLDESRNVFKQTEDLVANTFRGMEDALVNFVKTGKLDFKSLAQSIIADIARIQAKKTIAGILEFGLNLFGGGGSGMPDDVPTRGGRAIGGPVSPGGMYEINEKGRPEVLNIAGRQYLMTGNQGGTVDANATAGGGINVQVNVDASGSNVQGDNESAAQLGRKFGSAVRGILMEEMAPGGMLA